MVGLRLGRGVVLVSRRAATMEPYRIHMVEPIRLLPRPERLRRLELAGWNPILFNSQDVFIDLLTDSGTSALSARQWSAIMIGDESYAGSPSFDRFRSAITNLMPNLGTVFPVHQGRAAEKILAAVLSGPGRIIPSNGHFSSTRHNLQYVGITALDLCCQEGFDTDSDFPFKGNMDTDALRRLLEVQGHLVPVVFHGITNNIRGSQPASMANLVAIAAIAREFGKPLFIDGCRFAENAMFIKLREPGYSQHSVRDICREMFSHANGMWMSAKKDAGASIGGWLALDETMEEFAEKARTLLILTEGFPTYGGLAGRDLDAIAIGIDEGLEEDYLRYRIASVSELGHRLSILGVPIVNPIGSSSIFVNAGRFLPHIPPLHYPGLALACALYLEGGIRAFDAGSFVQGQTPFGEVAAPVELARLSFPRRLYTASHLDHVARTFARILARRDLVPGLRIVRQPPHMRFYSAQLEPRHRQGLDSD